MQVKRAIPLFEYMYLNTVAEFIFYQSSAHGVFAPDTLNVKEMNVNPGGKQHRIHPTTIPNDAPNPTVQGQVQGMICHHITLTSNSGDSWKAWELFWKNKAFLLMLLLRTVVKHYQVIVHTERCLKVLRTMLLMRQQQPPLTILQWDKHRWQGFTKSRCISANINLLHVMNHVTAERLLFWEAFASDH